MAPNIYIDFIKIKFIVLFLLKNPGMSIKIGSTALYLFSLSIISAYLNLLPQVSYANKTQKFLVGYNLYEEEYGHGLAQNYFFDKSSKFDRNLYFHTLRQAKTAGADLIKIDLFSALQGIELNATKTVSIGLNEELIRNLETVLMIARQNEIKVYLGLLRGNDSYQASIHSGPLKDYFSNIFNLSGDGHQMYKERVLKPLLQFLNEFNSRNPGTIFALDLFNEIEGATRYGYFNNFWDESRLWIKELVAFSKQVSPWLKLTVSAAWDTPVFEIITGYFSNLGLDFYDVHLYSNVGDISHVEFLCAKVFSDGTPIILGEYGQKGNSRNDEVQIEATNHFLQKSSGSCFDGALAWHLGGKVDALSYQNEDGSLRPAAELIKKYQMNKPL